MLTRVVMGYLSAIVEKYVFFFTLVFMSSDETVEEKELNAARLWKLAQKITSAEELVTIAILGLGADDDLVDRHLKDNHDNIAMASKCVLKDWKQTQPNSHVAYINMCKALGKVNKNQYVVTALK